VTFHSLRHLHADACRTARVRPEVADAIHGHSSGNLSARYGSGYPVELLAEAVEKAVGWLGSELPHASEPDD
jgi:integrase